MIRGGTWLAVFLIAASLLGCSKPGAQSGSSSTGGEPKRGGVLRVGGTGEPSGLDPHKGSSGTDHMYLYLIYDRLVNFDAKLNPKPGLAESWEVPDPKTIVLHLRKGVKFHDGTEFGAEAVKFNILRAKDAKGGSTIASELANINEVETPDALTVRLKLNRPDAAILGSFSDRAGMMVSPAAAQKYGDQFARNPVGAGEFRMVKWAPGDALNYERFADYWDKPRPYLDGVQIKIMPDGNTRLRALQSGQLDFIMNVPPQEVDNLKGDKAFQVFSIPTVYYYKVYFNPQYKPLDNKLVRQAINYAVDRQALVKTVEFGYGEVPASPFPAQHWANDPQLGPYPYDPEKARALLAQAGYAGGVSFDMVLQSSPEAVRRNEAVQAQLAAVGIKVNLVPRELAEGVNAYYRDKKYPAGSWSWTGRPDPDMSLRGQFHSTGFYNPGAYKSEVLEGLMDKGSAVYDPGARAKVYASMAAALRDEAMEVPLYFQISLSGATSKVQGFAPNLLGKPVFAGAWLQQ